jgi:hypothetical protein
MSLGDGGQWIENLDLMASNMIIDNLLVRGANLSRTRQNRHLSVAQPFLPDQFGLTFPGKPVRRCV